MTNFAKELKILINRYSIENGSDTPDFILAHYLMDCLNNWNFAIAKREKWYGRTDERTLEQMQAPPIPGKGKE